MTASGATIGAVIDALDAAHPGLRERVCDGATLRPGIAVVVDGETATLGLLEPVRPDSELHIVPAIAGGGLSLPDPLPGAVRGTATGGRGATRPARGGGTRLGASVPLLHPHRR